LSEINNYHLVFDENDNSPVFENKGRPIIAAVPLEASFGYQVVKLTVSFALIFNEIFNISH
jgi:hypothetical protein